ncbi:MAG: hypothetical protein DSM107014_13650 [Gomphosphaeria aponina SAG 52.96 = DSM 107014]|uniref:Uncharacterized protein n=1 Tax=Gomphosphaeria aponina SAG 52.96 = DSM 107014 TaxID=1521640 RepID=A0A941GXE3_9CHRO|nr:hypothetical protein [Gomphosphaeria aponina SAG 52.96 = DSM 107014]
MSQIKKHHNLMLVDLKEDVLVTTSIPPENHAALRSGFAGYPANPRWNASKFCAWKTGCHWRKALIQGEMVIRPTDSMLVPACEENREKQQPQTNKWLHFPTWAKQILGHYQTA